MKIIFGLFLWLGLMIGNCLALSAVPQVKTTDFQIVSGETPWVGSLTYLDYGSGQNVTIPSQLIVKKSTDKFSWVFAYEYPNEHKADRTETVVVSRDGKMINDEKVTGRSVIARDTVKIITEKSGTDNNKPALLRYTYLLGKMSFSIRKEVKYEGSTDFFIRNEYNWKR